MAQSPTTSPSFEEALTELESIVQRMDGDALTLEQSLQHYQRGLELLRLCQGSLSAAEQRIAQLEGDELKPLDPNRSNGDTP